MSQFGVVKPLFALLFCISPAVADANGSASSSIPRSSVTPGGSQRIAVCTLSGQDISRSGLEYLTELVRTELAKTEHRVSDEILPSKQEIAAVAAAGRLAKVDQAVSGRIAIVGDLFVVD